MFRRFLLALLSVCLLVAPAGATWSIVVVNRRTGEVAVASATCLERLNLLKRLATVVPGVGAGVIQSAGNSADLLPLTQGLRDGLSPAEILVLVKLAEPSPSSLQSGIVSFYPGTPVTFTGNGVGRARRGIVGEVGDLAYAIQGNVITGEAVVLQAEAALLNTPGDLGQKLLAAMQAARSMGGDGRCSCSSAHPNDCGSPPASFRKSAHVGFLVVTRIGDDVPPCVIPSGSDCSDGVFHLRLNVSGDNGDASDPDPVDQLTAQYADWRAARRGRPDGLLSTVEAVDALPADGVTKRVARVRLLDVDGVPLDHGGAVLHVAPAGGARSNALVGPVLDLGDGSYVFTLSSTHRVGTDRLVITADDGFLKATLYPFLEVRSEAPLALHCGEDRLSASQGGSAPFVLAEPAHAGGAYVILARARVPAPDRAAGRAGLLSPLGDPWLTVSAFMPGARGVLDATGRAEATFAAPPGALLPWIGAQVSFSALVVTGSVTQRTNAIHLAVDP